MEKIDGCEDVNNFEELKRAKDLWEKDKIKRDGSTYMCVCACMCTCTYLCVGMVDDGMEIPIHAVEENMG